jgi:hypothetical protein
VEEIDPNQPELNLGLEPIELARARFNCRRIARRLVSPIRWCVQRKAWAWLFLSILSVLGGISFIVHTSFTSEYRFDKDSLVSIGVMMPLNDLIFYSYVPQIQLSHTSSDDYGVEIWLNAKSDALPIILISRVDQTECSATSLALNPLSTTVKQNWSKDFYAKIRDILLIEVSQITFLSEVPKPASGKIVLYCSLHIKPHKTTYSERRVVFHYISQASIPGYKLAQKDIILAPDFERYDGFSMTEAQQLTTSEADTLNVDLNAARQISNEFPVLTLRWRDTESLLFRDTVLILTGAVFGLAGAFLVEWIKALMGERKGT